MKGKIITLLTAMTLVLALGSGSLSKVMAADEDLGMIVDGSVLTEDEESEGILDRDSIIYVGEEDDTGSGISTYGTYLIGGTAKIKDAGSGKITASGTTTAKMSCSLKLVVTVQRYSGGTWNYVTSWSASKTSGTYLSSTKTMSVTKGYYYRVKCSHSAGGEAGYSTTDGIKIS